MYYSSLSSYTSPSFLLSSIAPPIDLYFINNTPELVGGSVSAEFAFNRHGLRISCHLTHLDGKQDCKLDTTYSNIEGCRDGIVTSLLDNALRLLGNYIVHENKM